MELYAKHREDMNKIGSDILKILQKVKQAKLGQAQDDPDLQLRDTQNENLQEKIGRPAGTDMRHQKIRDWTKLSMASGDQECNHVRSMSDPVVDLLDKQISGAKRIRRISHV